MADRVVLKHKPTGTLVAAYGKINIGADGLNQVVSPIMKTVIRVTVGATPIDGNTITINGHTLTVKVSAAVTDESTEIGIFAYASASDPAATVYEYLAKQSWMIADYELFYEVGDSHFTFSGRAGRGLDEILIDDVTEVGETFTITEDTMYSAEELVDNYEIICTTEIFQGDDEPLIYHQRKTGVLNRLTNVTSATFDNQGYVQQHLYVTMPYLSDDSGYTNAQYLTNMVVRWRARLAEYYGTTNPYGRMYTDSQDYISINAVVDYDDLDVGLSEYSYEEFGDGWKFLSITRGQVLCATERMWIYTLLNLDTKTDSEWIFQYKYLQDGGTYTSWTDAETLTGIDAMVALPIFADSSLWSSNTAEILRNRSLCLRMKRQYTFLAGTPVLWDVVTLKTPRWRNQSAGSGYTDATPDYVALNGKIGMIVTLNERVPIDLSDDSVDMTLDIRFTTGYTYNGEKIYLYCDSNLVDQKQIDVWQGESTNPSYFTLTTRLTPKRSGGAQTMVEISIIILSENAPNADMASAVLEFDTVGTGAATPVTNTETAYVTYSEEFCVTFLDCCDGDVFEFLNKNGVYQNIRGHKINTSEEVSADTIVKNQAEEIGEREMIRFNAEIQKRHGYEFSRKTANDRALLEGLIESNDVWLQSNFKRYPMIINKANVQLWASAERVEIEMEINDGHRKYRQFVNELGQ